jgi:hypothetical protein
MCGRIVSTLRTAAAAQHLSGKKLFGVTHTHTGIGIAPTIVAQLLVLLLCASFYISYIHLDNIPCCPLYELLRI